MQVARYWRMKKHTYRLEGTRLSDGSVSVQDRPTQDIKTEHTEPRVAVKA
jgi:hypothetical protein